MAKYINTRYIEGKVNAPKYVQNNGIFKKCANSLVSRMQIYKDKLYYSIEDLPKELQLKYADMAIDEEDMLNQKIVKSGKNSYFYDNCNTKVLINDMTLLVPVVGNILLNDENNVGAFTVKEENGKLTLSPIIICVNCHWSDLYTGQTKYGNNVFCLLSDLDINAIDRFIDKAIYLKDAFYYLKQLENKSKSEPNMR